MQHKIFILAGEASGDNLGAGVMEQLQLRYSTPLKFIGVGGDKMLAQGLTPLFPAHDIAVMGLAEVLPKLNFLRKRINQCVDWICQEKPDLVLTIDSPDFSFRVQKEIRKRMSGQTIQIHYIAPSVWAWRPKRAKKIAGFLDHLLCVLPFEPPYFEQHGLPATFVGHPITEQEESTADIFAKYQIPRTANILTILPGSRKIELDFLLPTFRQTAELILKPQPDLQIIVPTFEHLRNQVEQAFIDIPNLLIVTNVDEKKAAMQHASAALAASGTVSLELAATKTPMIIAYKMSMITYAILKLLLKVKYASIINIGADAEIIPEYIQHNCTPEALSDKLLSYLNDIELCGEIVDRYEQEITKLAPPAIGKTAAMCAADVIENALKTQTIA